MGKSSINGLFSMAMLNNQMVAIYISSYLLISPHHIPSRPFHIPLDVNHTSHPPRLVVSHKTPLEAAGGAME